ncbi:MAG: hypothetical protein IKJ27_05940 [Clostridia bacterium]|nr:hypothetical protein [Clostridia bacterium]
MQNAECRIKGLRRIIMPSVRFADISHGEAPSSCDTYAKNHRAFFIINPEFSQRLSAAPYDTTFMIISQKNCSCNGKRKKECKTRQQTVTEHLNVKAEYLP